MKLGSGGGGVQNWFFNSFPGGNGGGLSNSPPEAATEWKYSCLDEPI